MRALVTVQTSGPEVDAVWQRVQQSAAAGDHHTLTAPGIPLTETDQGSEPLSASGHRRARIGPESWEWLTPSKGAHATRAQSHAELFSPRTHQIGSRAESFGRLAELSARRLS